MTVQAKYSAPQVCKITGVSYRQLDYWARTELIKPSLSEASGSGSRRVYSERDLSIVKTMKMMLDAGLGLNIVRSAVEKLQDESLEEGQILVVQTKMVFGRHGGFGLVEDQNVCVVFDFSVLAMLLKQGPCWVAML